MTNSEKLDAVGESLVRALVFSFGSVCFGSLFIRPVNVMKSVADHLRPNSEEAPMRALVASCISTLLALSLLVVMRAGRMRPVEARGGSPVRWL